MSRTVQDFKSFLIDLGLLVESRFPTINQGGCGVFASVIAQQLSKMGYEVSIASRVSYFGLKGDIAAARRQGGTLTKLTEWDDRGVAHAHFLIEFTHQGNTYLYDSSGLWRYSSQEKMWLRHDHYEVLDGRTMSDIGFHEGRLTLNEIKQLAASPEGWNRWFDRNQIPAIQTLIHSKFRRYRQMKALERDFAQLDRRERAIARQPAYTRLNVRFFERRPRKVA